MAQTGYLLISDISGYTGFLTHAELEHAEDILRSLITSLLDNTKPPLTFVKLEGDAVFSYALDGSFMKGQTLLEVIENIYGAFRKTLDNTRLNTTCTCKACTLIPSLDLKFVIHHGTFMEQRIGKVMDLQGADVIAVHRLLKNHLVEQTGQSAYAFFSRSSTDAAQFGEICDEMWLHSEEYEHIGKVTGYVYDLHPAWERIRTGNRVFVERDTAWCVVEQDVAAPPALVWDYLTDPRRMHEWMGVKKVTPLRLIKGRQGPGAQMHCAHGANESTIFDVLDWRPFDYITVESLFMGATYRWTAQLVPTLTGTRIYEFSHRLIGKGF